MAENTSLDFFSDCRLLHSPLAHPDLGERLVVWSSVSNSLIPEPLSYYGSSLTLDRFDDPEMIGFTLPRLGDETQHYLVQTRFNWPIVASVAKFIHCRNCPDNTSCKPKVVDIVGKEIPKGLTSAVGIVLANHHYK